MEGSNSGGKKIVFKKRVIAQSSDALDDLLGELLSEPVAQERQEEETPASQEPSLDLHYAGEIFDQFYRPLAVTGGIDRLSEIAREAPTVPNVAARVTRAGVAARDQKHQELAEVLAHQIYQLAQKDRETDIDVYLAAFNVVLADKTPQDAKLILDRANDFFTEHYYTAIRDRGERPEIYHQVIKRVGHEHSDRIAKIVKGLDVEEAAATLLNVYQGGSADKASRITDILLDLTERQLRAVREEFLLIPYKLLAKQAHAIIHQQSPESQTSGRRSIGKSEVYEHKRGSAFRIRDEVKALRYLLLGKSVEEIALIKRFYLDFGDIEASEHEIGLETHIRKKLSQVEYDRLGSLLSGWSPYQEAQELHDLIYPRTLGDEIEDQLSDPRDVVDRDHTQGIGPFLRRFKKNRVWRGKSSPFHRVLNQFELVSERVAALPAERFLATNDALRELFGYELDPTAFPSLALFDARRIAITLAERLSVGVDFVEIIQPMLYLEPRQCLMVQCAYEALVGRPLKDALKERVGSGSTKISSQELTTLLERYVDGHGRWALNTDILARYRGEEPEPSVWQYEYRSSEESESAAMRLAEVLDQDISVGSVDRPVKELLFDRTYDELNQIERAFYDLTDPKVPLLEVLKNCLSLDGFTSIELLLAGIDSLSLVQHIHDDPASAIAVKELPWQHVSALRETFERVHFVAIDDYLLKELSGVDEDLLVDCLAAVLTPEVFETRRVFVTLKRETIQDLEPLKANWTGDLRRIMAFERSFDFHFPRFRVHLKYLAAKQIVSPALFAEIVLCLEGVDPEINQRLLESFDAVDIYALIETLRGNKRDQRVIEETYDLLNPDAPLRRAVKEMKVDLDQINETLLHIEGYSAKDVAAELYDAISRLNGEELGLAVLDVVASPSTQRPNKRIPEDINWMDEMVFQIALAYQREYRADLVSACRARGVPESMLEELTSRVFGLEVCASARDLFNLIKTYKDGVTPPEYAEQKICAYLESRGARHRDRLVRAYNAFWAHTPGYASVIDDINRFFKDTTVKRKMHAMLLGVGGDNRGGSVKPVVLH